MKRDRGRLPEASRSSLSVGVPMDKALVTHKEREKGEGKRERTVGVNSASGDNWSVYAGCLLKIVKVDHRDGATTRRDAILQWTHSLTLA